MTGYFAVFALLLVLLTTNAYAQHVANPFVGATQYLNPDYTSEVNSAIATVPAGSTLAQQMATVATYPTAVWMDHMGAIAGPNSGRLTLAQHITAALAQQTGTQPVVMEIVIYDLPDRDCAALASNGEISIAGNGTLTGIQEYEQDYIAPIYNTLAPYASNSNIRFVLVIEPDSLPNMVTNTGIGGAAPIANCVAANNSQTYGQGLSMQGVYVEGIQYALNTFHQLTNAYQYLDIGQSAWLGWTTNMAAATPFYSQIVKGTTAGYASVDGFISDTANYVPVVEPYFTGPTESIGGNEVESSTFFQYDPDLDELDYVQDMYNSLTAAGFPSTVGFLIDTSRDGWGNSATRPTGPSNSTVLNTFVDASKLDQRPVRGVWCNIADSGLGVPPMANPVTTPAFANLEAYVWIKPPGESDGNYPGSTYGGVTSTTGDPNCNPANTNPLAGGATDSLANSPQAGIFWIPEFTMYVQNAYPVVPASTNPNPTFIIGASAATLSIAQGSNATDGITITGENGFTGNVTLAATGLPSGVTATFATNPTAGSSNLTLTVGSTATATTTPATITVTGTSGSLTESTTIALTITNGNGTLPGDGILGAGVTPAVSVCGINSTVPIPAYGIADYYTFQNNEWNSTATQCASVSGFGFDLTTANFDQDALGAPGEYTPATYPSIYWGCHWGNCTTGSTLPIQESALTSSTSSVSTVEPSGFSNDVAYDIWFNQTPTVLAAQNGQPNGTEIMIWINYAGPRSPFGTQVGTTTIDGTSWQVWTGRQTSWNIISYVQVPGSTVASNLNLMPFYQYATTQSVNGSAVLEPSWYLIDIEFGFEIWDGGQGLALTGFSASATSTTTTNPAPVISSLSPTSGAAGSSITISGSNLGSSDTVSFGSTAATITSSSATSLTVMVPSGLAAGAYNVTVTASGSTSNAETFMVTETTPIQTVVVASSSLTVAQSSTITDAITVSGFSGSATLAASGLPAGVTASFATNPTTSTSVLTVSASSTATSGVFTITITGTSSSQTASANITLSVTPSSCIVTSSGWSTKGNQIIDPNGNTFRIEGINWYGTETSSYVFHGLYDQDYKVLLNQIKSSGFNTVRIPFSQQAVETNPNVADQINTSNGMNAGLTNPTSLGVLDSVIEYAGSIGLHVILDNHRSEAGNSNEANGLWYDTSAGYSPAQFVTDWQTMATRYSAPQFSVNGVPIIIGMDLRNEPHLLPDYSQSPLGSCWTGDAQVPGNCATSNTTQNWPVAAEAAGNAILSINPNFLIFVEGLDCYNNVSSNSLSPSYLPCDWQGGNLQGVANYPVVLNVPNKVVYSAHDYGPDCGYTQPWETSSTTYATLEQVWNTNWAYISTQNLAPVWIGEFGVDHDGDETPSGNGSNGQWFTSLIQFLGSNPNISWSYWAFNGEDQMGLENSTYTGIESPDGQTILSDLTTIQTPTSTPASGGSTTSPSFTLTAAPTSLSIVEGSSATDTITVIDAGCFDGTVTFAASGLPSGVTASFSGNVLTLSASSTATVGSSIVTITGTSGSLTATTTVALAVTAQSVPSFTLSASPASLSLVQGTSGTSTINVTPVNGFTGTVTYAASGLPSGVTAAFSDNVLTLSAGSTATVGSSIVTITGTSGSLTVTTTVALAITAQSVPSFTLSVSPASLSLVQGTSGTSTINVTPVNGFTGTVTYAASGLPSGVIASFSSNVLTLSASGTATVGSSLVTITGTSGGLIATTTVALTVTQQSSGISCHVTYSVVSQWTSAFSATLTVANTGTTAWTNPTLTWLFANGQVVSSGWGGTLTQSGSVVSIAGLNYGNPIAVGTSDSNIGFNASWNNTTNAAPTSFAINGTICN
ncbi:MAG: glycoside hydrolase family 6 protein [Terracidiphilus sp.]